MTHSPIKFIKCLEKLTPELWLYTPGEHTNPDGGTSRYRMWIKFIPSHGWRVYKADPLLIKGAEVFTDCHSLYGACTDILKWFWEMTDYQNDPARLAALDKGYAEGIGPIPEFVIHPKYSGVLRAADMQLESRARGRDPGKQRVTTIDF